ncbi:MAG: 16S rRNA (cytosine(1402)-N(4))-methyltransferase RsmH [Patescibacteria group bacterium]
MPEHISVLMKETIEGLDIHEGDHVFEGTVGLGGHSAEIMKRIGATGVYIGVDEDSQALTIAKEKLASFPCKKVFVKENFRNIDSVLSDAGLPTIDKILLDIGLSNLQLEESGRGFSFTKDEPLIMSFATTPSAEKLTAEEIVNEWSAQSLIDIITGYGEEKFAWRIANAIVSAREKKPIKTTHELASIIKAVVPPFARLGRIHPATKTFQAIRITVNDELGALREGIEKGFTRLAPKGRMAVISFHSLEDRIVKDYFKTKKEEGLGTILTKKPVTPSDEELTANPKSRSSKLRIIIKN